MNATEQTAARHQAYRVALKSVARRAIDRGDFPDVKVLMKTDAERDHQAGIVAHYAATDLMLTKRTRLLPMIEVYEAIPELVPPPTAAERSELYATLIGRAA